LIFNEIIYDINRFYLKINSLFLFILIKATGDRLRRSSIFMATIWLFKLGHGSIVYVSSQ